MVETMTTPQAICGPTNPPGCRCGRIMDEVDSWYRGTHFTWCCPALGLGHEYFACGERRIFFGRLSPE